ncbi:rhomboid family intramembrane serine protease [bacterium]|nr:rhomboid family intramembrane serine protease [bacterium]
MTWALLGLNLAGHVTVAIAGRETAASLAFVPALASQEPWRLLTSLFVHVGLAGFIVNSLLLYLAGRALEDRIGHWRMLGLYLAGGVASNLFRLSAPLMAQAPFFGASGCLSALAGAFCVLMPWADFRIAYIVFFIRCIRAGVANTPAVFLLGAYVLGFWILTARVQPAAWFHLGAFALGIAVGVAFYGVRAVFQTEDERFRIEVMNPCYTRFTRLRTPARRGQPEPLEPTGTPPKWMGDAGLAALLHALSIENEGMVRRELRRLEETRPDMEWPPQIRKRVNEFLQAEPGFVDPDAGLTPRAKPQYELRPLGMDWQEQKTTGTQRESDRQP